MCDSYRIRPNMRPRGTLHPVFDEPMIRLAPRIPMAPTPANNFCNLDFLASSGLFQLKLRFSSCQSRIG
jgi:hypothetical protein